MAQDTKTFDPAKVVFVFNGHLVQGIAQDSSLSFTRNKPMWTQTVDIYGRTTRTKSNDTSGVFTVVLEQSSDSNDAFSAFLQADELNNSGKGPVYLADLSGREQIVSLSGWIEKRPDTSYSNSFGNRTYTIAVGESTVTNGGNS